MAHQQSGRSCSRTPSLEEVIDSEPEWDKIDPPTRPQNPSPSSSSDGSPPPEMSQKVILPPRLAAAARPTALPSKPAAVQTPTIVLTPAMNAQNSLQLAVQASTGAATPAIVVSSPARPKYVEGLRRIAESAEVRHAKKTGSTAEESSRIK